VGAYGDVTTKISWVDRLPNLLGNGAPLACYASRRRYKLAGAIIGDGDGDGDRNLKAFSKKANVLFLEKNCAIVRHTRACMLRGLREKRTNKMASEIAFVGDEEIQFLSSVSLPNLRQALGENFLDSDS